MKLKQLKLAFIVPILFGLISVGLSACQRQEAANTIKIGTIAGPETTLMKTAKKVLKQKYGINLIIVPFTDYTLPNAALNDGSLDANMFQTISYLKADIKARHYKLSIIGKMFIYPMGVYSNKIKNIKEVPHNATVAIPNDPANEGRALLLLQKAGLITLKPNASAFATPLDIVKNPKNLQFKQLDAAQLTRALPDVTLAVINTNYAVLAGLYPTKNSIFMESKDAPYPDVVVVRTATKNDPKFKKLMAALHSQAVLDAAKKIFKGQAIPAWK